MNIRNLLSIALVAVALLASVGCHSDNSNHVDPVDFPCICGTPEGAMEICLHPRCREGKSNPDNPDCACGTLSFGDN